MSLLQATRAQNAVRVQGSANCGLLSVDSQERSLDRKIALADWDSQELSREEMMRRSHSSMR